MSDEDKTKEQLINELAALRQRFADLNGVPTPARRDGCQTELLLALNAASASIEQSIYSEAQVLEAFRRQILQLGLYGGISLLDETGERLVVQITAHPGKMMRALRKLEKRVGVRTEGYSFALTQVDTYRQVVETGETLFVPDGNPTIRQLLPAAAQPFADLVLKAFPPSPTIFAPLKVRGEVRGAINVCGQDLTADDVPAVAAFANHLAITLDNARLFAAKQRAYEQLQASEEKYRAVAQLAADAIVLADAEGMIVAWNKAACTIFGYEEEEILGQPVTRLMPGPSRSRHLQAMAHLQATGESDYMGLTLGVTALRKDGRMFPAEVAFSTVETENDLLISAIVRDVSERKQAEAEIQQRTEDLALINLLNLAVNRGDTLQEVLQLLSRETKRIFSSRGAVVYLLSEDKKQLVLPYSGLSSTLKDHIEKVVGKTV
ncbi:MAG: PAS domain S-box protein, partial [Anaerolineae bacterium]